MTWSKDPPKEAGWYWVRSKEVPAYRIPVAYKWTAAGELVVWYGREITGSTGQWEFGPRIEEPEDG